MNINISLKELSLYIKYNNSLIKPEYVKQPLEHKKMIDGVFHASLIKNKF